MRVLVLGGYGNFGSYVSRHLGKHPGIEVIVAGRSEEKCKAYLAQEGLDVGQASWRVIDIHQNLDGALSEVRPDLVVHTSGPYQGQGYSVAEACIAHGAHYLDLADGRDFVCGIETLDARAKAAGVSVLSGASSVPTLSSAVVDFFLPEFESLTELSYGICTAQKVLPGPATTKAILGYVGRPLQGVRNGTFQTRHGWQDLHVERFPALGRRFVGNCDVPDLTLFPKRYPSLKTQEFFAGLEVPFVHLGLWGLSWLVRVGLLRQPGEWTQVLHGGGQAFRSLGSDRSGFKMQLTGCDSAGAAKTIEFGLLAKSGHGIWIPCVPAIHLAKRLASGEKLPTGASPCIGLMTLPQYLDELSALDVSVSLDGSEVDRTKFALRHDAQ